MLQVWTSMEGNYTKNQFNRGEEMKRNHLWYIIPVCLIFGILLGFYISIPNKITIDTGDNLKEMMYLAKNITETNNQICHNSTYECNCNQKRKDLMMKQNIINRVEEMKTSTFFILMTLFMLSMLLLNLKVRGVI